MIEQEKREDKLATGLDETKAAVDEMEGGNSMFVQRNKQDLLILKNTRLHDDNCMHMLEKQMMFQMMQQLPDRGDVQPFDSSLALPGSVSLSSHAIECTLRPQVVQAGLPFLLQRARGAEAGQSLTGMRWVDDFLRNDVDVLALTGGTAAGDNNGDEKSVTVMHHLMEKTARNKKQTLYFLQSFSLQ